MTTTEEHWNATLTDFTHWLQAAGRREGTITTRTWWIRRLQHDHPHHTPTQITPEQLRTWLANPHWAPPTRKSALASIRRYYHFLTITGTTPEDPTQHLLNITVPRRTARPTPDEILTTALNRATSTEEELMLLLAAYAGLRRTEIATLHTTDHRDDWLKITGKGGHTRLIPVHPVLTPYLEAKTVGYYFPGRFTGHRHPDYIGRRISRLLGPGYTSHQLRHWFATSTYTGSRDIRAVQQLLGHADINTTQAYVATTDTTLKTAVTALPDLRSPR